MKNLRDIKSKTSLSRLQACHIYRRKIKAPNGLTGKSPCFSYSLKSCLTPRLTSGFTLVEMLVVLVIIGLMSSAVILTFPEQKSAVERQAESFLKSINSVSESALMGGQSTAFGLTQTAYAFYSYSPQGWKKQVERPWEQNTKVEINLVQNRLNLPETLAPLIVFEPIGLSEPFTLILTDMSNSASKGEGKNAYIFISKGDGRVVMRRKT